MTEGPPHGPNAGPAEQRAGVGFRFAAVFSTVVVVVLAIALLALDRAGVASRSVPEGGGPQVVIVHDSRELLDTWDARRVRGALVVDVTRDLGFATLHPGAIPVQIGWPVTERDPSALYRATATTSTALWAAANSGIARSIAYVMTAADLAEKVEYGRQNDLPGISADGKSITANNEGYLRFVSTVFPADPGPAAVLNVDASYFIDATPDQFITGLGDTLDAYRLVTLNRSEDTTSVPDAARERLDRVAEMLEVAATR